MMAETTNPDESADSAFAIVQPIGGKTVALAQSSLHEAHSSLPTEITVGPCATPPAPSALPAFAQMPQPGPVAPLSAATGISAPPLEPPGQRQNSTTVVTSSLMSSNSGVVPNPFSVRASAGQSLNSVVHASPHVPHAMAAPQLPVVCPAPFFPPAPSEPRRMPPTSFVSSETFDMSFEMNSNSQQRGQPGDPSSPLSATLSSYGKTSSGNVWNWVNKAFSQSEFLTKVAEKAKSSMDNMITTLDPQMKDYLNPAGALELFVISTDADLVSAVKVGFSRSAPNLIVRTIPPAYVANMAQQIVGFDNGLWAAKEFIQAARSSSLVSPNSLVLGFSSFVVEFFDKNWYEITCVALNNGANVDLHAFSQPIAVPSFAMDIVKLQTPADYSLASTGLAYSVEQVMAQSHGLGHSTWYVQFAGVSKQEITSLACISLAYLYKSQFS